MTKKYSQITYLYRNVSPPPIDDEQLTAEEASMEGPCEIGPGGIYLTSTPSAEKKALQHPQSDK